MPTPYTVTADEIEQLLDEATIEECVFWGKELVVSYCLKTGFTIAGRSACIDPANFVMEVGRQLCRQDAERQLWQLEGYRKQFDLFNSGELRT